MIRPSNYPGGLSAERGDSIFANLASARNTRLLWDARYDFELPLDTGGGDSEWNEFGTGALDYPDLPFGVVRLEPDPGLTYGINQENCQGFDFTRGTDLWYRVAIAQQNSTFGNEIWAGMVDGIPTNPPTNTEFSQACIFHILANGQIDLEIWSTTLVQTLTNLGTFDRSTNFTELAYHYDGSRIEVAINSETVGTEAVPIVPNITLHGLLETEPGGAPGGTADFDYFYNAQLRQPL